MPKHQKSIISKKSQLKRSKIKQPSFKTETQRFIDSIESISRSCLMTMKTIGEAQIKENTDFVKFIKDKGIRTLQKAKNEGYKIKPENYELFNKHYDNTVSGLLAIKNVPRIFFCSLIHIYDAYLGKLLRVAFYVKPELLNASQKQFLFSELASFSSINEAREHMIEKEIETIIRDSHISHFDWMENRFGIPLRKDLSIWPKFIEITERRNLFVHCDGIVSSQYLTVCKNQNVIFQKEIVKNEELHVSPEYFNEAVDCILEIGVKLGQVLWRKLQPGDLKDADAALHSISYEFLLKDRYSITKSLLNFAVNTVKKHFSDEIHCYNLINLAIAYKFSGEENQALSILKNRDWSSADNKFKLAVAVLENRVTDAIDIMKKIGNNGSVSQIDYSSWPLFKKFRKEPKFLSTYKKLFGREFIFEKQKEQNKAVKK